MMSVVTPAQMSRFKMNGASLSISSVGASPLGLEANRQALQTAIDYALEQHLLPRRLTVDELFDETTRGLGT